MKKEEDKNSDGSELDLNELFGDFGGLFNKKWDSMTKEEIKGQLKDIFGNNIGGKFKRAKSLSGKNRGIEIDNEDIWLTDKEGKIFNGAVLLDFVKEVRRRYGEGVVRSILKYIEPKNSKKA